MNARQFWLVASREMTARGGTRAYQVSTAAIVVIAIAAVVAVRLLPDFFAEEPLRLALVPETQYLAEPIEEAGASLGREIEVRAYGDQSAAVAAMELHEVDGVLVTPDRMLFEDAPLNALRAVVSEAIFQSSLAERAAEVGITLDQVRQLLAPAPLQTEVLSPESAELGGSEPSAAGQGIGALSAIVLLMALSFYGQWVLVGVIEEKSNRVAEVLLATVRPWELLTGKVIGILLLAIVQIVAGVGAGLGAWAVVHGLDSLPSIAVTGVGIAVIWLVLGLVIYNFVYAAIGATVNRPEEATSATVPVVLPLLAGYFAGLMVIPSDPDSLAARVLSLFPLTAPLTMPSRIASGGGSFAEGALAIVLALVAIAAIIWLASRIYAGGILQTSRVGLLAAFRRARE